MKVSHTLVVFDLETTGTWVEKDKIVEIGMIKCLPDGSREQYVKRVNPGIPIPQYVSRLIGITDKDVRDASPFREIAASVLGFIGDADLAGFNLERFDLRVLQREMTDAGLQFSWQDRTIYDAQKIYHVNEKRNLAAGYKFYCHKELVDAHTALGDSRATLEILEAQTKKYSSEEESIETLQRFNYEQPDDYFDEKRRFRWWNGRLYPMFGKYAKKHSLREIARIDREYLEWILRKNFSNDVKMMIEGVLNGQYPISPGGQEKTDNN